MREQNQPQTGSGASGCGCLVIVILVFVAFRYCAPVSEELHEITKITIMEKRRVEVSPNSQTKQPLIHVKLLVEGVKGEKTPVQGEIEISCSDLLSGDGAKAHPESRESATMSEILRIFAFRVAHGQNHEMKISLGNSQVREAIKQINDVCVGQ